ncbi:MAG: HNH endonuclease [Methylococcaceae bacterium]|nr:HNH endonuclease [Methylococcaceae bacterium]
MKNELAVDKFMEFVIPVTETGCWLWTGETRNDYGRINIDGQEIKADIASWETQYGRLPVGQRLQHKCNVRCCVNPDHLTPIVG